MPAVAVIRKRLVLFIIIRFKGSVGGQKAINCNYLTRVLWKRVVSEVERLYVMIPKRLGKGEGSPLCKN